MHTFNIEQLIYFNLKNDIFICPFCGYSNDKIIDINNKSYFKIVNNINLPNFLFIGFDLSTNNDNVDEKGNPNSIGFINNIIWNRIKSNIDIIINLSVDNFEVYNTKFKLQGIISCPFARHYTAFLLDLKDNIYLLEKDNCYYYDDISNNNEIIKLNSNYKDKLKDNLPFILIYKK